MKKARLSLLGIAAVSIGMFAFTTFETGSITGKIVPAEGATEVWAFNETDTLKTPVAEGAFTISGAKAGTYTVVVDAVEPFQDATLTNIKVEDGKVTDLGDIKLVQ
jgi:hypothetical protein